MSEAIPRTLAIGADHPAFAGHFPGEPILPGVALLAEVLEAAHADERLAAVLGTAPRIVVAKFLAPVRPGALLDLAFLLGAKVLEWRASEKGSVVASGQFARADLAAP